MTTFFLSPKIVLAHVSVKPAEIGVGERTNFVVSVPTEEDVPTTEVRLLIPDGVQSVRPNVKPGWTITLKKTGEGENMRVSEILWTSGSIPQDQRDEFIFSAQAPKQEAKLAWKAYQTYANGNIVAWDQDPQSVDEHAGTVDEASEPKPFSVTNVINDVSSPDEVRQSSLKNESPRVNSALLLSSVALAISIVSFVLQRQNKKM